MPPPQNTMSPVDALTILLTAESLLLAVVGIAVTFAITPGSRVRWLPVPLSVVAFGAVAVLALAGVGAGFAWAAIYLPHFPHPGQDRVIAIAILSTISMEPLLALALALGLKTES